MQDGTPRLTVSDGPVNRYCTLGCFSEYVVVAASACVPLGAQMPMPFGALIGQLIFSRALRRGSCTIKYVVPQKTLGLRRIMKAVRMTRQRITVQQRIEIPTQH